MIRDKLIYAALGAAVATAISLTVTCATWDEPESRRSSEQSVTELPDPRVSPGMEPLSEALMVALAQAKNFHHTADVYLQEGDFAHAITAVKQILSIRFPDGAPEAEDVRLDARARAAKLLIAQDEYDEALKLADDGIRAAARRSFFLANLYTVKGEALDAKALSLWNPDAQATAPDDDVRKSDTDIEAAKQAASALRRDAIEAFEESIRINEALQKALMERASKASP